ncbi:hypothetical protein [Streptomyces sp. AK010]|uniref:hypothetical protein n=1 Tax=Streptomyces sp. AK010 TaxID=2723074 RepID=UPI001617C817|nr:hypothetical protein [Streptomyces sp. AK010]MBB6415806.1 hypothetical protein [Streptomyces sp. AK010]
MTSPVISREQAFANARRVLDAARDRRDSDRAAGCLDSATELILRRLERDQRQQAPAVEHRAAA